MPDPITLCLTQLQNVIKEPSSVRYLTSGRVAYWDELTKSVVVRNPKACDGGTAFIPDVGISYFLNDLK